MHLFWGDDPATMHQNIFAPLGPTYDVILGVCALMLAGTDLACSIRRKPKLTVGQSSGLWVYAVVVFATPTALLTST